MPQTIFTLGHSNLNFMRFLSLLQAHNITHIIDIRSIPYSRRAPWSNKSRLSDLLKPFEIHYTYLGHKLGGKKQKIEHVSKQQGVTPEVFYKEGIQSLLQLSLQDTLCLMCAESDPANCHRQHIIAQTLINSGIKVFHVLKDSTLKEAWKENLPIIQPELF